MHARFAAVVLLAMLAVSCRTPFRDKRTPSGGFCTDMPVYPAGQEPQQEYHRLGPIASSPEARTEAERLESLRKAACDAGGDGVMEAVNEEIRTEQATYVIVASGTAIMWVRREGVDQRPITVLTQPKPVPTHVASAEPAPPPPATTTAAAPPPPPPATTTAAPPPPPPSASTPAPKPTSKFPTIPSKK